MIVANLPDNDSVSYQQALDIVDDSEQTAWIRIENTVSKVFQTKKDFRTIKNLRDAIFMKYRSRALGIAQRYIDKLPYAPLCDKEDLQSAAYLGLQRAILAYDLSYGTAFMTYATFRIKGAIGDELRKLSNVPKDIPKAKRELEIIIQQLYHQLNRKVTYSDLRMYYPDIDNLNIGGVLGYKATDIIDDPLLSASMFNQLSTEQDGEGSTSSEIETVFSRRQAVNIESRLSKRETVEKILLLFPVETKVVNEIERRSIFYMYYFCGYTITRISQMKNRSTSWVSSMKKAAEEYIRNHPGARAILGIE